MAKTPLVFSIICSFALVMLSAKAQLYEYFQMVQQWPPATCSGVRCSYPPPNMFTIHGLWPSRYSCARFFCSGFPRYDSTKIATLTTQLSTLWPDVIRGNNAWFWKHEWEDHGTCSNHTFNQHDFFQTALDIRTDPKYDLLTILKKAGLGPTATTMRQYQDIERAIEAFTGMKPGLRCNTNARTRKIQLHEIILCFDHDGVTPMNCTDYAAVTCPAQFVWLDRQPLSLAASIGEFKDFLVYEVSIAKFLFVFLPISIIAFVFRKRFYPTTRLFLLLESRCDRFKHITIQMLSGRK